MLKTAMFDEEYNFNESDSDITLNFKIAIDINNNFDFLIDYYYIPKFLQQKGFAKNIVLSAIHNFSYILLSRNPSNHKALNIIESLLLDDSIYINKYEDFFLFISKKCNNAINIAQNINTKNILIDKDPEL